MFMPMTVNIKEKHFFVVGGGKIATKRIFKLLNYKAQITVVSPEITIELDKIKDQFSWIKSEFKPQLINEADYVIAGTNSESLNREIRMDCNKKNIPCLDLSSGKESDFYLPGIIQKEYIQVSVSTCGESPIITKQLTKEIERLVDNEWTERAIEISRIRKLLKAIEIKQSKREQLIKEISKLSLEDIIIRRKQYENKNRL